MVRMADRKMEGLTMEENKLKPYPFCEEEEEQKKKMVYNGVEYDWLFTLRTKRIPIKEEIQDNEN